MSKWYYCSSRALVVVLFLGFANCYKELSSWPSCSVTFHQHVFRVVNIRHYPFSSPFIRLGFFGFAFDLRFLFNSLKMALSSLRLPQICLHRMLRTVLIFPNLFLFFSIENFQFLAQFWFMLFCRSAQFRLHTWQYFFWLLSVVLLPSAKPF